MRRFVVVTVTALALTCSAPVAASAAHGNRRVSAAARCEAQKAKAFEKMLRGKDASKVEVQANRACS